MRRRPARRFFISLVFSPGGDAAADVAFGFVLIQHRLDLEVEGLVQGGQAFGQVLMYRRLGYPEFGGGGTYRCLIFHDVKGQSAYPFFNIPFQPATLPRSSSRRQ